MNSPILRSLQKLGRLNDDEFNTIVNVLGQNIRRLDAGQVVQEKNEPSEYLHVVLDGWAYRHKILANGRRQIVAYLMPGDVTDLPLFVRTRADHVISALTNLTVASVPFGTVNRFFGGDHPGIARALWIKSMIALSIQREWSVNLGQRSAPERIGHLLCELFHRMKAVDLVDGNQCFMPLTQSDLAEATGLSLVHVNKRLQDLRGVGLIVLRGKSLTIPDLDALETASLFNGDYLRVEELELETAL